MKDILFKLSTICVVAVFSVQAIYAGPWMRDEGEVFLSVQGRYENARDFWNEDGDRSSLDSTFHKGELDLYAEYGVQERVKAIGRLSAPYVHQDDSNFGLGDLGFGVILGIVHDSPVVGALQVMATVPLHNTGTEPSLGYGAAGAELNALVGGDFSLAEVPGWIELGAGLRFFFANRWDTWHGAATLGIRPTPRLGLALNSEFLADTEFFRKRNTDAKERRITLGFSPMYNVSEYTRITAGIDYDVWGRSTLQALSFHIGTQLTF